MSLVPPFHRGVWNAWIFMVLLFLAYVPGRLINKEAMSRMTAPIPFGRTESILWVSTHLVIIPFAFIYSIFLPLKLGTEWFYVGLPICLLALLMNLMAGVSFATTPPDEPVTRGIYRVSRNPAYFGIFLLFIGIGIASASWILLLCAVLWIASWHILVRAEERFCLETYGDGYREHLNTTPRWIGMPKSGKR